VGDNGQNVDGGIMVKVPNMFDVGKTYFLALQNCWN